NKALDASSAMRDTVASVVFPLFYQLPSHHSPVPGGFFTASQPTTPSFDGLDVQEDTGVYAQL
ncbi:MAG: hypothetical protein ACREYE_15145, partial [Gammaproteobacteria bacterium]